MPRSGAALIIAIAVLAALLFLALPFLYSQSASVAGARAGGWDGTARRAQATAEGVAAGAAIYATGISRSPSLQLAGAAGNYTALPGQIANVLGIYAVADTAFRTIIETDKAWTDPAAPATVLREALDDPARVLHGALIEDESRRVDPNGLGERAWAVILRRAKVEDPYTIRWDWTPRVPVTAPYLAHGDWRMVEYGRLARALARWRPGSSGGRFASLSDLLGADPNTVGLIPFGPPGYDPVTGLANWPYVGIQGDITANWNAAESDPLVVSDADASITKATVDLAIGRNQLGYRTARLTQVELERLRPYLTFHALGQGRGGLLDVGSIVAIHPEQNNWDHWNVLSDLPTPLLTDGSQPLWRNGAWIRDADGHAHFGGFWQDSSNTIAQLGEGLGLDVPPALSINVVPASSALTLLYSPPDAAGDPTAGSIFGVVPPSRPGWPEYPDQTPVTALDQIPLLRWLDPRSGDGTSAFERPALGTGGWGVMTIEGSATAIDPSGRAQSQRRRRMVMQTVPQERPVEAAWATQAELEALIRQRQGSWIQAGPHPTSRIVNWGADAADMPKLANAGWIEPAPLGSFSKNNNAVDIDWTASFGLTGATAWGSVLGGPVTAPDPKTVLTPQGVRLSAGDQLAWTVDTAAGPLRFGSNVQYQEMTSRHIALRFCFPSGPADATIVEARAQDPGADYSTPADGIPEVPLSDDQSVWRVEYRHATEELVLVMANAALPWTEADRARFGISAWKTGTDLPGDTEDGRCLAGLLEFAPADPASRVEFHYIIKGGLATGRWYHLQAFCASDRPGLHGLILDGIVGRDAITAAAATETGDHYTFPSLRLSAKIDPVTPATAGGGVLTSGDIPVVLPPATLTLPNILRSRGLVRIDDEFFSYTGFSGNALTGVQRARRVNTNQGSTIMVDTDGDGTPDTAVPAPACWPVTQAHAQGAMVTPGWSQSPILTGPWLRGQVHLKSPFQPQPAEGLVDTSTWLPGSAVNTKAWPTVLPITTDVPTWPSSGLVKLTPGGVAAFSNTGDNKLTLDWTGGAPVSGSPADIPDTATVTCLLISMSVVSEPGDTGILDPVSDASSDGVTDRFFADFGALQLISPLDGTCEWVRFTGRVDRDADATSAVVKGKYFWRADGWKMDPMAPPAPLTQARGAMRTPWRKTDDWPAGVPVKTLVLPVQNLMANTDRFEAGDAVTIVPRVAGRTPVQVVVRHAARDGYPAAGSAGVGNDTSNEWFALAHRVPDALPDPPSGAFGVAQTALIGRGWSGDDLSMIGNDSPRRGALPMLRLLAKADGTVPARLFVGCPDIGGFGASAGVIIDDLCAGPLSGSSDANAASPQVDIVAINGATYDNGTGGVISALAGALPVRVETSQPIFTLPDGNLRYGLALIDGEVFAWRKETSTSAVLIARGLLGSAPMEHRLAPAVGPTVVDGAGNPRGPVQPTLPIVILPMGPVAELCSNLPAALGAGGADVVEIDATSYYQDPEVLGFRGQGLHAGDPRRIMTAPFQLISSPDGGTVEVLKLFVRPASNQRLSAPWLRGLYGTSSVAWTGTAPAAHPAGWTAVPVVPTVDWALVVTPNPVVIGWWPRFAPGVPENVAGADLGAQLRSRAFAWAGFPLRLHGARFDPAIPVLTTDGIVDLQVTNAWDSELTARALATGTGPTQVFDWENAPGSSVNAGGSALTSMFGWSRFQNREVDGAELRIHWYRPPQGASTAFENIAAAQGSAPRLGATDGQAMAAPAGTAAVRLRCVAPTRILAVEEVR